MPSQRFRDVVVLPNAAAQKPMVTNVTDLPFMVIWIGRR